MAFLLTCEKSNVWKRENQNNVMHFEDYKYEVYVSNPWHPNEVQVIPMAEFEKMALGLYVQDMGKNNEQNTAPSNRINIDNDVLTNAINRIRNRQQIIDSINQRIQSQGQRQSLIDAIKSENFDNITPKDMQIIIAVVNEMSEQDK